MSFQKLFDKVIPNKRLTGNILILALAYAGNYATPLIAIPILASRIGMESYGLVALSQGIMMVIVALGDFGISFTGVRNISQTLDDPVKRKWYIGLILITKLLLLSSAFLLVIGLVALVPQWSDISDILIPSFALVIGHGLFPKWYFEGKQKMTTVAILNLGSRFFYLVFLMIFIHEPSQTSWINVLNGGAWFVACIVGWLLIIFKERFSFNGITIKQILTYLKSNVSLVYSTLVDTGFRNSGVIIAGFLLNATDLGVYSVLDKVIMLLRGTFSFVYSALYPEVCTITQNQKTVLNSFFISALKPIAVMIALGSPAILFFATPMITSVVNEISADSIQVSIRIISLLPILILINLPIGLTLLSTGMNRQYLFYNLLVFTSFLILSTMLGRSLGKEGIVLAYLLTEILATFHGYRPLLRERWLVIK